MDEETLQDYIKAGKIASEALQFGKTLIIPDASMLEVLNQIEKKVRDLGGELAFPAQISCDDLAAHFCPNENDIIFKEQVCCLDVGVHINGFIGDNALTVDLSNNHQELVIASREALNNALKIIRPGTTLSEIGKTIGETIQSCGFLANMRFIFLHLYLIMIIKTIQNLNQTNKSQ
jgi:methionyl aminopeptidase